MLKSKTTGHRGLHKTQEQIRADKPMQVKKTIQKEYFDGTTRMYLMTDGSIFFADKYDEVFLHKNPGNIMPPGYKGTNPDKTKDWMK